MLRNFVYCVFISGVGKRFFLEGKRKGAAVLMAFALLPFFTLIVYSLLAGFVVIGAERYFFSFVFVVSFFVVFVFGKSDGVKQCVAFEAGPMPMGVVCASIFFWVLALIGWFFCVVQPLLSKDSGPGEVDIFSWDSQRTPPMLPFESNKIFPGDGDVVFVGTVVDGFGRPVSNYELVMVFNNYKVGGRVVSDRDGEFSFRMPPGVWGFSGLYAGGSGFEISYKKDWLERGGVFSVGKGGKDRVVNIHVMVD